MPRTHERAESRGTEAYASELPDLSGPPPRRHNAQAGRRSRRADPTTAPATGPRPGVAAHTRPGARQHADPPDRPVERAEGVAGAVGALFFVWMIAVAFLYLVLGGMGVWSKLNSNVGDLLTSAGGSAGGELVSSGTIFGGAALIGLVNIVLLTAMGTVGAFIYNLTTDLVGGIEVTLADRD